MISGINLSETIDYILPEDTDNPTVWKLGVISSYLMGQLAEKGSADKKMDMMFKVCQVGIKGWSNLKDVEYKTEKQNICGVDVLAVPMDVLEKIPMTAIGQIALRILEINKIAPEERKNS